MGRVRVMVMVMVRVTLLRSGLGLAGLPAAVGLQSCLRRPSPTFSSSWRGARSLRWLRFLPKTRGWRWCGGRIQEWVRVQGLHVNSAILAGAILCRRQARSASLSLSTRPTHLKSVTSTSNEETFF